jgi:hypothetical protein
MDTDRDRDMDTDRDRDGDMDRDMDEDKGRDMDRMGKGMRTGTRTGTETGKQKGTGTFPGGIRPRGTIFEFEYIIEFETEFENNLGYE